MLFEYDNVNMYCNTTAGYIAVAYYIDQVCLGIINKSNSKW
jgi:hypothetical protein